MLRALCLNHRSILNNMKSIIYRVLMINKDVICYPLLLLQYSILFHPLLQCSLLTKGLLFWYDKVRILSYMASATHASCIVFPTKRSDTKAPLHTMQ